MSVRLLYVDDSGDPTHRWITYSWLELGIEDWALVLRRWLAWRKALAASTDRIPVSTEIHTAQFMSGRGGNPSLDPHWAGPQRRSKVMVQALGTIATLPRIRIGTAYRHFGVTEGNYGFHKADLYERVIAHIDTRLASNGDFGMLVVDGDGGDPHYRDAHRKLTLKTRAIVEDPSYQESHRSQLVQVADIIAWVSYQHLCQNPRWAPTQVLGWHDKYLKPRLLDDMPLRL